MEPDNDRVKADAHNAARAFFTARHFEMVGEVEMCGVTGAPGPAHRAASVALQELIADHANGNAVSASEILCTLVIEMMDLHTAMLATVARERDIDIIDLWQRTVADLDRHGPALPG